MRQTSADPDPSLSSDKHVEPSRGEKPTAELLIGRALGRGPLSRTKVAQN